MTLYNPSYVLCFPLPLLGIIVEPQLASTRQLIPLLLLFRTADDVHWRVVCRACLITLAVTAAAAAAAAGVTAAAAAARRFTVSRTLFVDNGTGRSTHFRT